MKRTKIFSRSLGWHARGVIAITLLLGFAPTMTACGRSADSPSPTAPSSPLPVTQTGAPSQLSTTSTADARVGTAAVQADGALKSRLFCAPNLIGPCVAYGIGVTQGYLSYNAVNPTPDHRHAGIDFGGSYTVYSPIAGRVLATGNCGSVVIEDARRVDGGLPPRHLMLHMKNIRVSSGQAVRAGTILGVSSNVSYAVGGCIATGVHLHYEIRRNYGGVLAVGPTSCGSDRNCTTAALTYDPLAFPF